MQEDTIPGNYIVYAKAKLDSGWHVFTHEPGGDGLLIATNFDFDQNPAIEQMTPIEIEGKVIQKEMDGMGMVSYFEKEAIFKRTITLTNKVELTGIVRFQVCNDEMCLPPAEDLFYIKP